MILQIIQQILGIILFFLPGILLSYIIFPKTDIIKRAVYSIVLALSILKILGVFLYLLNLLTLINTILSLIFLILLFLLILKSKDRQYKTHFNIDIWYLVFSSLIGTIWKVWFWASIKNFSDSYGYAFKFVGETVPDLGYYTGMAADRVNYIGLKTTRVILDFFCLNIQYLNAFIITFVFLGFIYLIFSEYRNRKLAYIGVGLMALGPIELFHITSSIAGHSLSYISLFPLFLLFKSKEKKIFWIALLLAIAMMFTYYTTSVIMLLASISFIFALFIKELIKTKKLTKTLKNSLTNKKMQLFLLIAIILASYIYLFSNMLMFSIGKAKDFSDIKGSFSKIELSDSKIKLLNSKIELSDSEMELSTTYKDPTFLGLSAIRWQMLFFFLCGLTFILHIIRTCLANARQNLDSLRNKIHNLELRKKDFSENNIDLLLCLIPILIISYGFIHVNLPTRIFDYFAFFGLLVIKIPKKYLKIFFILSFIFILITSFYVAEDKRVFLETSDKEIEGAKEISNSLKGKIFSDIFFANQLISNGYYNVTGADDNDILVYSLFYQSNPSIFLDAINTLDIDLSVDYIALTKRMREQYILMVNFPQKPLISRELYEENLIEAYNNGDVKIYKTKNENK